MSAVSLTLEGWAPGFGVPVEGDDLPTAGGDVDVEVERATSDWAPITPSAPPVTELAFVDGVRRIDGVLWRTIAEGGAVGETHQALAVSLACGRIRCAPPSRATVVDAQVQRLLIGPSGFAPLPTSAGTYEPRPVADDAPETLQRGVQERLRRLERRQLDAADAPLVVVDGPLDAAVDLPTAMGYVKSHHVGYLPESVRGVVAELTPGQRTPLFLAQSSWTRFSWYLKLPHGRGHPWAGVVRGECTAELDLAGAVALADAATATLPRFASQPHRDARAPQNLYPIGGLEAHCKHLLGEARHVERALRTAVART